MSARAISQHHTARWHKEPKPVKIHRNKYPSTKTVEAPTMYTTKNYKTKKALKDDVLAGKEVTLFAPGLGSPVENGTETVSGPHYPEPHRWYAQVTVVNGKVTKVK